MNRVATFAVSAAHFIARAEVRLPALWRARLQCDGLPEVCASLRNVSRSGFMAEISEHVPAGTKVLMTLPIGGTVSAEVRWTLNNRIGCRLEGQLSHRQLALLVLSGTWHIRSPELGMFLVVVCGVCAILLI